MKNRRETGCFVYTVNLSVFYSWIACSQAEFGSGMPPTMFSHWHPLLADWLRNLDQRTGCHDFSRIVFEAAVPEHLCQLMGRNLNIAQFERPILAA